MTQVASTQSSSDTEFNAFVDRVRARVLNNMSVRTVYRTKIGPIFDKLFIPGFPADEQQFHNCNACRKFIDTYGSLAYIDTDGTLRPVAWSLMDSPPPGYDGAVKRVITMLGKTSIAGVFYNNAKLWGKLPADGWSHFAVPGVPVQQKASERMAEKSQDFQMLMRFVNHHSAESIRMATKLARMEVLNNTPAILGMANWIEKLVDDLEGDVRAGWRSTVLWQAVATAPAGFAHINTSVFGSFIKALHDGEDKTTAVASFNAKMHPLAYRRPTAEASAGAVAAAEKLVQQLDVTSALERRYAVPFDVPEVAYLWRPRAPQARTAKPGGVFGSVLKPVGGGQRDESTVAGGNITFARLKKMLPNVGSLKVRLPAKGNYGALTTQVYADAKPILQWDTEEQRNPVSWFLYNGGSLARTWGLVGDEYVNVAGVIQNPSKWYEGAVDNQPAMVMFYIEEAFEVKTAGELALFPSQLKASLHGISRVVEQYSKRNKLQGGGSPEAAVAGLLFSENNPLTISLDGVVFTLDRWE